MDIQTESQSIPIVFRHKKLQAPESLFTLCLKYVASNLDTMCSQTPEGYTLHEGLTLPNEICEPFIETYQNNGCEIFDCIAHLFKDVTKTNLRSVNIRNSSITDDGLEYLLHHDLYKISISHCQNLTHKTYLNILKHAINLQSLTIGPNVEITPYKIESSCPMPLHDILIRINKKAPNLKHLVLRTITESDYISDNIFLAIVHDKLPQLKVLDLSYCLGVGSLRYMCKLMNLHTLILFDVKFLHQDNTITNICTLKSLVVLDISQTDPSPDQGMYRDGNKNLALIGKCLPNLMYLDISGTNLAGTGILGTPVHPVFKSLNDKKSDIPGLEYRIDNPLEFLGLYRTMHNACRRHNIPAKIISGNANEEQIYNAVASSIDKPKLLQCILHDLHHMWKDDQCTQNDRALNIILEALTRYAYDKLIQISGSAALYYILQGEHGLKLLHDITVKRRVLTTILNGMNTHKYDETMIRNGCLILSHLNVSRNVMLEFKRLVHILLHTVTFSNHEGFLQRVSVFLLKSIACKVNTKQKFELGDVGVIEKMMTVIKDLLSRRLYDDVLISAWSTMWNITDEVPINCSRFLNENGMKYFFRCLRITFPNKDELIHNMVGLMSSVAEVKELRPKLMRSNFIGVLSKLLLSTRDGIEVSYYAARVIAHLASDGYESWTISTPSRYRVLTRMSRAMQDWNLDADRNINYYSFKAILKLAQVKHTPQCAHWVTWTLANLTKVHPEKYCSIVIVEDGLKIMDELLEEFGEGNENSQHRVIYDLAQTVINQCQMYVKNTVERSSE